ncbi:MAG TPA: FlgD immunoglobulin-like domain containing protein [Acidobacteriota bacterium]|nr:FlgD immunoglobulin-like domain containing protein [Acidobacteriota bacterium]
MRPHIAPFPRKSTLAVLAVLALASAAAASARSAPDPFLRLTGEAAGDLFGTSVAANGDVNGDGRNDAVIGAQWNDADAANAGRAYVYFGGAGGAMGPAPSLTLRPDQVQSRALAGYAVAIVGDVNGDGHHDFAVGAPTSRLAGRVFLYWGGPATDGIPDRVLAGLRQGEFFGGAVAGTGDMNGDGFNDVYAGAPWFAPFGAPVTRVGRGYLFFGGTGTGSVVDIVTEVRSIGGLTDQLQFTTSVGPAGDVNGDGFADVLVGQPADGRFVAGRAFIFYGGIPVHRVADIVFLSEDPHYRVGHAVAKAGDFDGDGVDDFLVGAPDSGEDGVIVGGRAYLYRGGQTGDERSAADLRFEESVIYDNFGAAVAGDADVNGDGWDDILIGAPVAEGAAGIRAGRVYVYFGGPGADAVADVVLEGDAPDAAFGTSISLGDLNGDGVADALIGAPATIGSSIDPGHVLAYSLVAPLPARAFAHDEHRTLPLTERGAPVCLRVEPVDGAFEIADIDPATLRLSADGFEAAGSIGAIPGKRILATDSDGNGAMELEVCFEREDLRRLFAAVRGRREVTARISGALLSGRAFEGETTLTVVGTGPPVAEAPAVSPNPLNPEATLGFTTSAAGDVDVRLYDAGGRLVRTLAGRRAFPAGRHRLRVDGRDDAGRRLASGVYFFLVRTPDGDSRGRFVIAK